MQEKSTGTMEFPVEKPVKISFLCGNSEMKPSRAKQHVKTKTKGAMQKRADITGKEKVTLHILRKTGENFEKNWKKLKFIVESAKKIW